MYLLFLDESIRALLLSELHSPDLLNEYNNNNNALALLSES